MTQTLQLPEALRFLDSIGEIAAKPRAHDALVAWVEDVRQELGSNWDRQIAPDGTPWTPWHFRPLDAPADHPTLFISGTLRRSTLDGGPGHVREIGDDSLRFGTTLHYAATHQFGDVLETGRAMVSRTGFFLPEGSTIVIEARPFLGVSPKMADKAADRVADFLTTTIDAI